MTTAKTRLAGGVAALFVATVSPAVASSSPARPVALGKYVTLTGSSSYVRDVTITRPVTVSASGSWKVEAPKGRFAGFALRRAGTTTAGTFLVVQTGYCLTRGCTRVPWAAFGGVCLCGFENSTGERATLAPGRYRLYLIADGAPVTVRLTLPGLSGRTLVSSGTPHRPVVDTPPPAQQAPDTPAGLGANLYSAGASHASGAAGGLHFLLMWKLLVGTPRSVNHGGACLYDGKPTEGPLGRYQAPCDVGTAGGQLATGTKGGPAGLLDQYVTLLTFFGVHGEGDWSLGGYLNSGSPATEAHTQLLWLDF